MASRMLSRPQHRRHRTAIDIVSHAWNALKILSLDFAQLYMDNQTFRKILFRASAANASQIAWCPFCKNVGQTYTPKQAVLICHSCKELFCCRHTSGGQNNSVPWHPQHTCEEFDQSKRNPSFRIASQIKQAKQDEFDQQSRELARQIEIAGENWELSLTRKDDEAKLRKIEKARVERERREAEERERLAREQKEAARRAAREAEERVGENMVRKTFGRCPFCYQAVEKTYGW
ncbi:hypothetical protein N0V82_008721 [Gnomoniopsis sp. IMI 355080]|nr:hypothetical protein N0V82_008721 [Gnomoniopsis sp. IMI 355080]